eukprot:gnl/MRDRNA2_/MRDRNA2_30413_c0_seq1.p1 gnl/MRDRNA2_/MRDRNA2_30413_c0~~gnl/MRDRNA2_/MRDRNA2_30413_c0_seq1.p1  ORF type:complete len:989 (-),score=177.88 gnl/MRDRNA2_/MRDRNA2_30413_c0_seq1:106-2853(-)
MLLVVITATGILAFWKTCQTSYYLVEAIGTSLISLALVLVVPSNWYYSAILFGETPRDVWGSGYKQSEIDTQTLLLQLGILMFSSLLVCFRAHVAWVIHLIAVLANSLPGLVLGNPNPQAPINAIFLAGMCAALFVGLWSKERRERQCFLLLLSDGRGKQTVLHECHSGKVLPEEAGIPALSASACVKDTRPSPVYGSNDEATKLLDQAGGASKTSTSNDASWAKLLPSEKELESIPCEKHNPNDASWAKHLPEDGELDKIPCDPSRSTGKNSPKDAAWAKDVPGDGELGKIAEHNSKNTEKAKNRPELHTSKTERALLVEEEKTKSGVSAAETRQKKLLASMAWTQKGLFQSLVGCVIVFNAATLGAEMDYGANNPYIFYVLENIFAAVFTLELIFRLHAEGRKYFMDAANILDFLLVVVSVGDVWIATPLGIGNDNMRTLSIFRMLRLLRLARLLRLFRMFKELAIIVSGFVAGAKTLMWAGIFLLIVVYIFALISTDRFGKASTCEDAELAGEDPHRLLKARGVKTGSVGGNGTAAAADTCDLYEFDSEIGSQFKLFGTVDRSMLTLYICLTEGCGFDIIRPMTFKTPWVLPYWYIFIFITSFGILNVIIGLFCENVMQTSLDSRNAIEASHETLRQARLDELNELFQEMDDDNSGSITRAEFIRAITEDEKVMACMEDLGLDDDAALFDTLDVDHTGSLSFVEFFQGMMLLSKGGDAAKKRDLVSTYLTCQSIYNAQQDMMKTVKDTVIDTLRGFVESGPQSDTGLPIKTPAPEKVVSECASSSPARSSKDVAQSQQVELPASQTSDVLASLDKLCSLVQNSEGRLMARMEALEGTVRQEVQGLHAKLDGISQQATSLQEKFAQGHSETYTLQARIAKEQAAMMSDIISAIGAAGGPETAPGVFANAMELS